MAISRLEKSILEAQGVTPKKAAKMVVPTEYEVEKYSSAVYLEEEQKILKIKPSDWTQYAFRMLNKDTNKFENFNFNGQRYWIDIYNSNSKKVLCKTGRQVAKSTFLGNRALTYCCLQLGFHVLYVSPSQMQTKEWMNTRINQPIRESEVLKKFEDSKLKDNTQLREFTTGSKLSYRYAFLSASRIRGLSSVDCLILDEIQSILVENIPIIEQTTFASNKKYKYFLYSGTPLSLDNPIEDMWSNYSTQNVWAIPCHRHSFHSSQGSTKIHWNYVGDDKNIGLKSLICERCGEEINPRDPMCHWVSLYPEVKQKVELAFEGFAIPQVISPMVDWRKVVHDKSSIPKAQFYNETLGLSYDNGEKPLSHQDIIDNCDNIESEEQLSLRPEFLDKLKDKIFDGRTIFAGLDWGSDTDRSLTVLTIATYINDFFVPFFWKKFEGAEADVEFQMKEIVRLLREWRVNCIGSDYGSGIYPNDRLAREFGAARLFKYQYSSPKCKIRWEPNLGRFIIHRSETMLAIIAAIKRRNVFRFPNWTEFEPFAKDFLSLTASYNSTTRMTVYQRQLSQPDDSFHALNTCFLASMIFRPRLDIIVPGGLTGYSEDLQIN